MNESNNFVASDTYQKNGLTRQEVAWRISQRQTNLIEKFTTRTIPGILRNNICTIFNAVLFASVITLLIIHTFVDAMFLLAVTFFNICLGIIEELRAKWALDRLEILRQRNTKVMREGMIETIPLEQLVQDDLVIFEAGDPIIADGELISTHPVSIDESLLTGEADALTKNCGDKLLSGSFCLSGHGCYHASLIGKNSHVNQLTSSVKSYKIERTPLQKGINKIIEAFTTILAFFLILLILASNIKNIDLSSSILAMVTIIKSLVPVGLLLVMTLSFALGAYRIARQHVLVQKISTIEAMGHINTICFDKTGTIGANHLHLHDLSILDLNENKVIEYLQYYLGALTVKNQTIRAIENKFGTRFSELINELSFSAVHKTSAVEIKLSVENLTLWLGAPEYLVANLSPLLQAKIHEYRNQGLRVLLFAQSFSPLPIKENLQVLALIVLRDELRPDITKAIEFYRNRGVEIKILSGDHPDTVESLARLAKIEISGEIIDGHALAKMNPAEFAAAVKSGQIFGSLLPQQKKQIIAALQADGKFTGMVGDGVNDILALKQADVGIAMNTGSAAARDIADLILLEDSFAHLPNLSTEGDQIIYNLKRIAKLFVTKNIYILFFVLFVGFIGLEFPLSPRSITWIDALTIGIPTAILTFMIPKLPPQNTRNFIFETLQFALITGITIAIASLLAYAIFYFFQDQALLYGKTASISVIILMNLSVVFYLALPERKSTPHWHFWLIFLLLTGAFLLHFLALAWPLSRQLLGLSSLKLSAWLIIFALSIAGLLMLKFLNHRFAHKI